MAKKKVEKTKTKNNGFFSEVREELKKVKWPAKEEMTKYLGATIIFIILFGVYFYGLDAIFAWFKGIIG